MVGWDQPLSTQQIANAQQQDSTLSIVKEHLLNNPNTAPTAPSWEKFPLRRFKQLCGHNRQFLTQSCTAQSNLLPWLKRSG